MTTQGQHKSLKYDTSIVFSYIAKSSAGFITSLKYDKKPALLLDILSMNDCYYATCVLLVCYHTWLRVVYWLCEVSLLQFFHVLHTIICIYTRWVIYDITTSLQDRPKTEISSMQTYYDELLSHITLCFLQVVEIPIYRLRGKTKQGNNKCIMLHVFYQ